MENREAKKLILIEKDVMTRSLLLSYLSDVIRQDCVETFGGIVEARIFFENNHADIIILEVDSEPEIVEDFVSYILKQNPRCTIIATSYNRNTSNIIRLMRVGVKDFLLKPVLQKEIVSVVENILSKEFSAAEIADGCLISVFSNKGGIGKTSVATNLALELANISKEKVALLDLNFQLGDVSAFFDTIPKFTIPYVVENLENVKSDYVGNMLVKYKKTNLFILADSFQSAYPERVSFESIQKLLAKLKQNFSFVVVDMSSSMDEFNQRVLSLSSLILHVACNNLPSLNNAQRFLNLIKTFGISQERTKVVINRYIEDSEITTQDIENLLNKNIFWKIPNNYLTQIQAINKGLGVSELNSGSNLAKSYKDLASYIIENLT